MDSGKCQRERMGLSLGALSQNDMEGNARVKAAPRWKEGLSSKCLGPESGELRWALNPFFGMYRFYNFQS